MYTPSAHAKIYLNRPSSLLIQVVMHKQEQKKRWIDNNTQFKI